MVHVLDVGRKKYSHLDPGAVRLARRRGGRRRRHDLRDRLDPAPRLRLRARRHAARDARRGQRRTDLRQADGHRRRPGRQSLRRRHARRLRPRPVAATGACSGPSAGAASSEASSTTRPTSRVGRERAPLRRGRAERAAAGIRRRRRCSSGRSAAAATGPATSTSPRAWRSIRRGTSTSPRGCTTSCRCSTAQGRLLLVFGASGGRAGRVLAAERHAHRRVESDLRRRRTQRPRAGVPVCQPARRELMAAPTPGRRRCASRGRRARRAVCRVAGRRRAQAASARATWSARSTTCRRPAGHRCARPTETQPCVFCHTPHNSIAGHAALESTRQRRDLHDLRQQHVPVGHVGGTFNTMPGRSRRPADRIGPAVPELPRRHDRRSARR